jgi:galactokinase
MQHSELRERAAAAGTRAFGSGWHIDGWAVAPGRIELIGNHIDYNGGPVLAGAIDRVIVMATGPIDDAAAIQQIAADVRNGMATCYPAQLLDWRSGPSDRGPVVYLKGVVAALMARSIPVRTGVGLAVAGDIPPGFGMSSSAALCLASILALTADDIAPNELVAIAREAEHRAGAMVGAMDQSASVAGGVIRFDGRDNTFELIQPDLGEYVFAVADSGVKRSLRTSAYGTRVKEAEEALRLVNAAYGLNLPNLATLAPRWNDIQDTIGRHLHPTLLARVRHVVTESIRVNEAEQALRDHDWIRFGQLMDESGKSSAVDYDISHPVVEDLVSHIQQQPGVLGARMMGGGNGGPALVLLEKDRLEAVRASLATFYARHPISQPNRAFHACRFGPGAHREPV